MKENKNIENDLRPALFEDARKKAEAIVSDRDKLGEFLRELEEKLKAGGKPGRALAKIPLMISLLRRWWDKKYEKAPMGTILAVAGALLYWLMPWDFIPDTLPVVGITDDMAVMGFCLKLVNDDLEKYEKWRDENRK